MLGPRTFDLSGEPDGTYTFRVRSSDPAGNISTEANDSFALDRSAPAAPTITAGPTGDLHDQNAVVRVHRRGGRDDARAGSSAARRWSATGRPA